MTNKASTQSPTSATRPIVKLLLAAALVGCALITIYILYNAQLRLTAAGRSASPASHETRGSSTSQHRSLHAPDGQAASQSSAHQGRQVILPELTQQPGAAQSLTVGDTQARAINIPVGAKPVSELKNQGRDSALAAAETFAWAVMNRQTDVTASLINFSWADTATNRPGELAELWSNGWVKKLPEPWLSQIRTPQRLVAFMHENEVAGSVAYALGSREILSNYTEIIKVSWYSGEGRASEQALIMRLTPSGWTRDTQPFLVSSLVRNIIDKP